MPKWNNYPCIQCWWDHYSNNTYSPRRQLKLWKEIRKRLQQRFYAWKNLSSNKRLKKLSLFNFSKKKLRGNEITVCIWGMENVSENKKLLSLADKRHALSDQLEFEMRFRWGKIDILNNEFRQSLKQLTKESSRFSLWAELPRSLKGQVSSTMTWPGRRKYSSWCGNDDGLCWDKAVQAN